ncbi:hypothetical protein BKA62DRAFT_722008 [Auriculariales sp. MPI-PUGE-AT-0066]|nr:hypothetical protein BKA62DRAFT_722008 [Auriculariales sp. MPI-PUGE-AT-0066]
MRRPLPLYGVLALVVIVAAQCQHHPPTQNDPGTSFHGQTMTMVKTTQLPQPTQVTVRDQRPHPHKTTPSTTCTTTFCLARSMASSARMILKRLARFFRWLVTTNNHPGLVAPPTKLRLPPPPPKPPLPAPGRDKKTLTWTRLFIISIVIGVTLLAFHVRTRFKVSNTRNPGSYACVKTDKRPLECSYWTDVDSSLLRRASRPYSYSPQPFDWGSVVKSAPETQLCRPSALGLSGVGAMPLQFDSLSVNQPYSEVNVAAEHVLASLASTVNLHCTATALHTPVENSASRVQLTAEVEADIHAVRAVMAPCFTNGRDCDEDTALPVPQPSAEASTIVNISVIEMIELLSQAQDVLDVWKDEAYLPPSSYTTLKARSDTVTKSMDHLRDSLAKAITASNKVPPLAGYGKSAKFNLSPATLGIGNTPRPRTGLREPAFMKKGTPKSLNRRRRARRRQRLIAGISDEAENASVPWMGKSVYHVD